MALVRILLLPSPQEQYSQPVQRSLWRENVQTALPCHFGVAYVLPSHLMHCSPMVLWHGVCMAPPSVTRIVSEKRRPGVASFGAPTIGDVARLFASGVSPSFSARFREAFGNGERVDQGCRARASDPLRATARRRRHRRVACAREHRGTYLMQVAPRGRSARPSPSRASRPRPFRRSPCGVVGWQTCSNAAKWS